MDYTYLIINCPQICSLISTWSHLIKKDTLSFKHGIMDKLEVPRSM